MERLTTCRYDFQEVRGGHERGQPAMAVFAVENHGGQNRNEILRFHVIEARALMWEDALRANPELRHHDPIGHHNYRQYIRAITEALKRDLI